MGNAATRDLRCALNRKDMGSILICDLFWPKLSIDKITFLALFLVLAIPKLATYKAL